MFKKKPNIKPLAPLRSSDRRRTADSIISSLGLEVPKAETTDPDDKAAATAGTTSLRNSLLPDNSLSARFTTTHGPNLKQVSGTLYVGAHPGEDQRVLWVKLERPDRMYPTVYTLWRNRGIVPLLHTPGIVVEKMQGGADLMTPGLTGGPPFPEKAKKGAVVAVASLENPSVPMAVGVCEIDVSGLGSVRGAKGHAVQTLHWAGDEIWGWSATGKPGGQPPSSLEGWLEKDLDDDLAGQTGVLNLSEGEEEGGVSLEETNGKAKGQSDFVEGEDAPVNEGLAEVVEDKELTTKEIDESFFKAFLYGVHHFRQTNKDANNFGLEFPLTQSFVMSNLVQPFLPGYTPKQSASLQIKKSSHKSIKKFIKSLDKRKIIKSKDRDVHEVVILDIDFDDRHFLDSIPYRLPKKETAAGTAQGRGGAATSISADGKDASVGQKLKKIELYRPKEKFSPILDSSGRGSHELYTAAELRPIITQYVETEQLISPTNKRLVKINPVLANAVFDGSSPLDKEVLAKGTVPRDTVIDRIIKSCSPFYLIQRESSPDASSKPKAGAAPKIQIVLETRSGNKTVTKVHGLEAYYIPPQPLADELRKTCAGSTSVDRLVGSSPKNPVMEVMVQGPQKDAVIKALEKRGVNRNWVEIVDKTKGKKKG